MERKAKFYGVRRMTAQWANGYVYCNVRVPGEFLRESELQTGGTVLLTSPKKGTLVVSVINEGDLTSLAETV